MGREREQNRIFCDRGGGGAGIGHSSKLILQCSATQCIKDGLQQCNASQPVASLPLLQWQQLLGTDPPLLDQPAGETYKKGEEKVGEMLKKLNKS